MIPARTYISFNQASSWRQVVTSQNEKPASAKIRTRSAEHRPRRTDIAIQHREIAEPRSGTWFAVGSGVPSQQHEILVELFRNRPELACELLRDVAGLSLAGGTAELASNDLSQAIAVEYRADAVTVIRDRSGAPTSAVIVEVQLHVDRGKRLTWPQSWASFR